MAGDWKRAAKAACAAALHHLGARRAMAAAARQVAGGRRVLILAYHRVVEDFDAESQRAIPGLLVSAKTFERHLQQVRALGYEFGTLSDALEVNAGTARQGRDVAVLTFDDGYRDNHDVAFPLLKKHGVPATIFLPTAFIGTGRRLPHDRLFTLLQRAHAEERQRWGSLDQLGGGDVWAPMLRLEPELAVERVIGRWPHAKMLEMIDALSQRLGDAAEPDSGALLDWEQCRNLRRSSLVSFGAHTVNHVPLHAEGAVSVERELRESRQMVERELGSPCRDFAFPNGYHSRSVLHALVRAGYRSGVTTEDALNRAGSDPFTLRRKTLWENHSRGLDGAFSPALLACQVDSVFGMLGLQHAVPGDRTAVAGAMA